MTMPPDFGGTETEKSLLEDLGVHPEEHSESHEQLDSLVQGDHEAHAPGSTCVLCGAVVRPGENVRRRADGSWMHEVCPPARPQSA
jgi:hypothetical protein